MNRPAAGLLLLLLHSSVVAGADAAAVPGGQSAPADAAAGADRGSAQPALPLVEVLGRRQNLIGEAISASQGVIGADELEERPRLRTGDLVEYIPGMVATQHSGSGKANQYFLRGFNLDHGTDFAQFVDGMPVNMRTHGHGQGYSDLNFVIPELIDELSYRKGPYYADVGDFSTAGTASYRIAERVPSNVVQATVGEFGYARGVAVGSASAGETTLAYGIEAQTYDGPWTDIDESVRKKNLALKLTTPLGNGTAHLTALAYGNRWNSPDQVPQRAIDQGLIDRFGSLDTTVGGESSRYSLSGAWSGPLVGGEFNVAAYAIDYDLKLWSDFTYFLDDPVHGDQFEQFDHRRIYGFDVSDTWKGAAWQIRAGLGGRYDDIGHVGLSHTQARHFLSPVRDDAVEESSVGPWLDGEYRFNQRLRAYAGVRYDDYRFHVDALQPQNAGRADASKTSLKGSVVYAPLDLLELYLSYGQGLHSNDARGTTIRVDPTTHAPVDPVTPLVPSHGSEIGARVFISDRVNATLSLWQLDLASELLFVGDAGTTQVGRPSERRGAEFGVYWFGGPHWRAELEASYSDINFSDRDPAGNHIPGSIPLVLSAGVDGEFGDGWFGDVHVRRFGPYPLIEDNSVLSKGSTLVNLRVGRKWEQWTVSLDALNVLGARDHDIDYFYASRLPGEPAGGVDDVHLHVFEPRALRLNIRYAF